MLFLISFFFPFTIAYVLLWVYARRVWETNGAKRRSVLEKLGIAGTEKKTLVGFFHPYWCVRFKYSKRFDWVTSDSTKLPLY